MTLIVYWRKRAHKIIQRYARGVAQNSSSWFDLNEKLSKNLIIHIGSIARITTYNLIKLIVTF